MYTMITVFLSCRTWKKTLDIAFGDGRMLEATGCGTVVLMLKSGSLRQKCKLNDVLYVSELTIY